MQKSLQGSLARASIFIAFGARLRVGIASHYDSAPRSAWGRAISRWCSAALLVLLGVGSSSQGVLRGDGDADRADPLARRSSC